MDIDKMLDSVVATICEYQMITRGERVVCAVSGGADSVAMLRALSLLRERLGFSLAVAHLNHGLRGEESNRDQAFVAQLCDTWKLELYTETLALSPDAPGVEERAREARYAFFDRARHALHAQKIATAHHAEDNLETLLFHLARGTGLQGLCGIPPVRGCIIRPLLFTQKQQILSFLQHENLSWVEDSSNQDEKFTRNLIRKQILPVLREIHPDAISNSTRCIKTLIQDERLLSEQAEQWLQVYDRGDWVPVSLGQLPDALCARVIRRKYKKISENKNQDLDFSHVCAIINLIRQSRSTGCVSITNDCCVRRAQERIYFTGPMQRLDSTVLHSGESMVVSGFRITCLRDTIIVRGRRDGDRVKFSGRKTRLVKKIFCDAKVPFHLRDRIPVIEKNGEIIAVCGFGFAERYDGGVLIEFDAQGCRRDSCR